MATDVLFSTEEFIFSYRVAGILIHNGNVLLQCPEEDTAHAFPGGHIKLGENTAEALIREFKEETGADITVGNLDWIGEMFFPWGDKKYHQISLYYRVFLNDNCKIPMSGSFLSSEKKSGIIFYWIPIEKACELELYPMEAKKFLLNLSETKTEHFISYQK